MHICVDCNNHVVVQVNELEAQVKEIQASCATASDVQRLQDKLAQKVDQAVVDQLSGGSAQELQGLDGKVQALEKAIGTNADAIKVVESALEAKAAAGEVADLKAQAEV